MSINICIKLLVKCVLKLLFKKGGKKKKTIIEVKCYMLRNACLLYGMEAWTLVEYYMKRLEVFEMWRMNKNWRNIYDSKIN